MSCPLCASCRRAGASSSSATGIRGSRSFSNGWRWRPSPAMLKLAGKYADGTITWMTGPKTIENHILPGISAAAKEAGRADPRVICGLPIAVTNDVDGAKEAISKQLKMYGMLPSYRAMLDREGVEGPADLSLLGDEAAIRAQIQSLRDAGVTDFNAAIMPLEDGTMDATLDLLQSELG